MREVVPNRLWVGASGDVKSLREFVNAGGRAVVEVAHEVTGSLPRDLIVGRFPLDDGAGNDPQTIRMAVRFLAGLMNARIPALFVCGAGMSRSPSIAAAALSIVESRPFDECLVDITRNAASDVSPALWADVVAALQGLTDS